VKSGKKVRPVEVRTGLSDGLMTEITGGDLKQGQQIIIGVQPVGRKAPAGGRETANPFMPDLPPPPAGGGAARP
jgi:multidrug efflux pump subunit AcrA (membrane-fusion protein)